MSKPRELWISTSDGGMAFSDSPFESNNQVFHYREVMPIDWEKVFKGLPPTRRPDLILQEQIQELVEKQLSSVESEDETGRRMKLIYPSEGDFIILASDDWRIFEAGQWRPMTVDEQIEASK